MDSGSLNNDLELPRLLYMGDVPVEASYHGSALLFRLLKTYPGDKLTVVETGRSASQAQRRLNGVCYRADLMPLERLSRSRFHNVHQAALLRISSIRANAWVSYARRFHAEAILTVSHGAGWITAATLARKLGLPLHLVCHDEWARAGVMQHWKDLVLRATLRAAASRLCVSPFMAEEYRCRYGVMSDVLYPSRDVDSPIHDTPPARLREERCNLTVVFAGTINGPGMVTALRTLASVLAKHGGCLHLYGPLTAQQANVDGLDASNIINHGLVPSSELMSKLRAEADVLYVPMSFEEADRNNMQISFPSKLADYTAVGLPLLIHGPEYCSAVRWARENVAVAAVVTDAKGTGLDRVITQLAAEPALRMALGAAALEVGSRYFAHEVARNRFFEALRSGRAMVTSSDRHRAAEAIKG